MRKTPWTVLTAALAALALAGCGASGSDENKTGKPHDDDGTVPSLVLPAPSEEGGPVEGMDEVLQTAAKAEGAWVSAPWALAAAPDKASTDLQIVYVAGDTACYAHAGFTLEESDSKVTLGSYTTKNPDVSACPTSPAGAFKWGTVKLGQPLGDRTLVHAGVADLYSDFNWSMFVPQQVEEAPPADGGASAEPAEDATPNEEGEE
jgi:hypothetical protein